MFENALDVTATRYEQREMLLSFPRSRRLCHCTYAYGQSAFALLRVRLFAFSLRSRARGLALLPYSNGIPQRFAL